MAYPGTGQPKAELLINGTWVDVTSSVRGESKITVTRGRTDEQGRVSAQRANFSINNRSGLYSTRNPLSAYYGLIPLNTRVRITAGTPSAADTYALLLNGDDSTGGDYISTPDTGVLDITGDIEVRVDLAPFRWRPRTFQVFLSKWDEVTQCSWIFYMLADGTLKFRWTVGGVAGTNVSAISTAAVPVTSGRLSLKVTLDVDNGAAGNDVKFYTASSIDGAYTQLGSTVTGAGTTSIYSSTSAVCVGGSTAGSGFNNTEAFGGRVYAARVYNGIAGTLRANPDFSAQAVGTTSFADSTGLTWTVSSASRITSDRVRFYGELSALPQSWDKSGRDVWIATAASGILRRLSQGASPLRSPMYRNFTQYSPHGYWPLEDGANSSAAASAVSSGTSATATDVTFAADSGLPGSDAALQFTGATSRLQGQSNTVTATDYASLVFYIKTDALPASGTPVFATFSLGGGAISTMTASLSSTTWQFDFYDTAGTNLLSQATATSGISPAGQWVGVNVLLTKSGSNVQASTRWDVPGVSTGGVGPNTVTTGAVGAWRKFDVSASRDSSYQVMRVAHVFMSAQNLDLSVGSFPDASNAYDGETAIARLRRLATEEGESIEIRGMAADSEVMGYQTLTSLVDLVYECADADQGILAESRDSLALTYRSRVDLENRADFTLSESSGHLTEIPMAPGDDQGIVNDVTVSKPGGATARAIVSSGALSTATPPNGAGRYAQSFTINGSEDRLLGIAEWKTALGTWDTPRFSDLTVSLHRTAFTASTALTLSAMRADVGDTLTLADLPVWMPPDDVPLLIQGYTETMDKFTYDVRYNTTPAGAYAIPVLDSDTYDYRVDSDSTTVEALTTTETIWDLTITDVLGTWSTTDVPYDVVVNGEVCTVTAMGAVTGTGPYAQQATCTRSVNGVVRTHAIGSAVHVANPAHLAL